MWRQGDPLSPYLFIIAEEVLSQNITQMVSRGLITPLSVQPGYDQVFHLFFADDIWLFMRASTKSIKALQLLLLKYQNASGQHFNIAKSHLFLGRMQPRSKKKISSLTGMSESKFPTTYLGVPLFQGAPKRRFFLPLLDSVRKRLCGWKGKWLSFAGRLVLIKHVLASILVHCFLALPVPRSILKELDKLMRNFLWSASEAKLKAFASLNLKVALDCAKCRILMTLVC